MTENGFSGEHIRDVWQRFAAEQQAQQPTQPISENWQQVQAQMPIQPPADLSFTAQELTEFFDFRHRPGLASWGEFCADKGYSFAEAIQPLIDRKTMEHHRSIVETITPSSGIT